jgi:hypothetical protein
MWHKSKIDLEQLAVEMRVMSQHSKLWEVLKTELTALGNWKNKARGNPKKGYAMRGSKLASGK